MEAPEAGIDLLLAELGFDTPKAATAARARLESAGLTRPGKRFIARAKLARVRATLAALARWCGGADCAAFLRRGAGARELVLVSATQCESCRGSASRRAARQLAGLANGDRLPRILVVGGSPRTHAELSCQADVGLEFRLVDGTAPPRPERARADIDWADAIVIWASTELSHKVSGLYAGRYSRGKLITVPRRGTAALLEACASFFAARSRRG